MIRGRSQGHRHIPLSENRRRGRLRESYSRLGTLGPNQEVRRVAGHKTSVEGFDTDGRGDARLWLTLRATKISGLFQNHSGSGKRAYHGGSKKDLRYTGSIENVLSARSGSR